MTRSVAVVSADLFEVDENLRSCLDHKSEYARVGGDVKEIIARKESKQYYSACSMVSKRNTSRKEISDNQKC